MHGNTGPADHLRPGDRLRRAGAEGCAAAPSHERGGEGESFESSMSFNWPINT